MYVLLVPGNKVLSALRTQNALLGPIAAVSHSTQTDHVFTFTRYLNVNPSARLRPQPTKQWSPVVRLRLRSPSHHIPGFPARRVGLRNSAVIGLCRRATVAGASAWLVHIPVLGNLMSVSQSKSATLKPSCVSYHCNSIFYVIPPSWSAGSGGFVSKFLLLMYGMVAQTRTTRKPS